MKTFIKLLSSLKKICIIAVLIFSSVFSLTSLVKASSSDLPFTGYSQNMLPETLHQQTRLNEYSNASPKMTILIHGQGQDQTTWANDIVRVNSAFQPLHNPNGLNTSLVYESNSMIETLRRAAGQANVYVAKMKRHSVTQELYFVLHLLTQTSPNELSLYTKTNVTQISDASLHSIIIFDSTYEAKNDSHEVIYRELDYMIDKISYDIKVITGNTPKVNLIAHSRGGLLNVLYAYNHPFNVDSMFSMGTPYHGSNLAAIAPYISSLSGAVSGNSGLDILNPAMMTMLKDKWNSAYQTNSQIKAHALGGMVSFELVEYILKNQYLTDYTTLPDFLFQFFGGIVNVVRNNPGFVNGVTTAWDVYYDFIDFFNLDQSTGITAEDLDYIIQTIDIIDDQLVMKDDFFIDLESQQAPGYNGFERYSKVFTSTNSELNKVTTIAPPIVHNLEPRDLDMIHYVVSKIDLGAIQNQFGTIANSDGTLSITSYRSSSNTYPSQINIPTTIQNKDVTGIYKHAFDSQIYGNSINSITSINIPEGIYSIGDFAFRGTSIQSITIPGSVTNLGVGVFADTNMLTQISVASGNTVFQSNNGVLFTSDSKQLIHYPMNKQGNSYTLPSTVTEVLPHAFYKQKYIHTIQLSNVKTIGIRAFSNSVITNLTGNQVEFTDHEAFHNTPWFSNLSSLGVHTLGFTIIKYNGTSESNLTLNQNVKSISADVFKNHTELQSIVLPETLDRIGSNAFNNTRISSIVIPRNVLYIGAYAFSSNPSLSDVRIANIYPVYLGFGTFDNLAYTSTIKIPESSIDAYEDYTSWYMYSDRISALKSNITFDSFGGSSVPSISNVVYNQAVNGLQISVRNGYHFQGWFYNSIKYDNQYIWDLPYATVTLKAQWSPIEYAVDYQLNGGTNHESNPSSYTINSQIALMNPQKTGYTFDGWYDSYDFSGQKRTAIHAGSTGNKTIYAKWIANTYSVSLDPNGNDSYYATVNPNVKTVTFDDIFSLPIPVREGYTFQGWYTDQMVKITNQDGQSITPWSYESSMRLIPMWSIETYYIKIHMDGSVMWLGNQGFEPTMMPLEYGAIFISPSRMALDLSQGHSIKAGYKFMYFVDSNGIQIDETIYARVPDYGTTGLIIELFAYFETEYHSIYFDSAQGTSVNNIFKYYNQPIVLPTPTRHGYTFGGWVVKDSISGYPVNTAFTYVVMPDLTQETQQNGSIGLKASWNPIAVSVTFNSNGGSSISPRTFYYNTSNYMSIPTKDGYTFAGWYDINNVQYANSGGYPTKSWDKITPSTLYAKWTVINYSITYHLNGSTNSPLNVANYTIESPTINLAKPTKIGYVFIGWRNEQGDLVDKLSTGSTGDKSFTAEWDGEVIPIIQAGYYQLNITNSSAVLIIDMTNAGADNRYEFTISDAVTHVTFKGNSSKVYSKMNIIISSRQMNMNLLLWDMNFVAPVDVSAIYANSTNMFYLNYQGTNSVVGGNGTSKTGIGQIGNSGRSALSTTMNLYISGQGTLSLIGGAGGASGQGATGSEGEAGSSAGIIIANGGAGKDGTMGLNGIKGANGGTAVSAFYIQISSPGVTLQGGTGGTGGKGGTGGRGGNGGNGGGSWAIAMNGGRGGNGGKGGTGGEGGNGGFAYSSNYITFTVGVTQSTGLKGIGGNGGNGGRGGNGGSNGPSFFASGNVGDGGTGGLGGSVGYGSGTPTAGSVGSNGYKGALRSF